MKPIIRWYKNTTLPVNASVISRFWNLYLDLLVIHQAELQLIITLSISLQSHCVNCSLSDLLYSFVLLIPIRCPICPLLAASIVHFSLHSLLIWNWTGRELLLNWTLVLKTENCLHTGSLYNLHTDHTENSASIVKTCLSNHCVAMVTMLTAQKTAHVIPSRWIHWCFITQQWEANTRSSTVACIITCLLSRCLAMLWPSTLQYAMMMSVKRPLKMNEWSLLSDTTKILHKGGWK
jgi:hypothetical protein